MKFFNTIKQNKFFILIVLILLLTIFNLYDNLGKFPIYSWDEARHGVSAFQMMKSGNYIVNMYRNHYDYWNLKPPLSFWSIILGFKIFGFNEFGFRFFSGIYTLGTILFVTAFTWKKYGPHTSLIATLAISSSTQLLINHSGRTGDADALFVFLFTVSIVSMLLSEGNLWWLSLSGFAFSLAFLTKSWHAINILAIQGLFLLFTGIIRRLRLKHWIVSILTTFLPILIWAVARFQYDGMTFFSKMVSIDLLSKTTSVIERHVGGPFYYVIFLFEFFGPWMLLLIILAGIEIQNSFFLKQKRHFKFNSRTIGIFLWVFIPLLFFSIAKTKVRWYIIPVYPPLSILIGILGSKFLVTSRKAVIMAVFFAFLSSETYIQSYIHHPPSNLELSLVKQTRKFKNFDAFVETGDLVSGSKWGQNAVLTAELYSHVHIINGGISSFTKGHHVLLIIKNGEAAKTLIENPDNVIASKNSWGYLLKRD